MLVALRDGRHFAVAGRLELPADGVLAGQLFTRFDRVNAAADGARRVARAGRWIVERCGVRIPPQLAGGCGADVASLLATLQPRRSTLPATEREYDY